MQPWNRWTGLNNRRLLEPISDVLLVIGRGLTQVVQVTDRDRGLFCILLVSEHLVGRLTQFLDCGSTGRLMTLVHSYLQPNVCGQVFASEAGDSPLPAP